MQLASIRSLVQSDLENVDRFIMDELHSDILLIRELIEPMLQYGGKRIRPLLVVLTARALFYSEEKHLSLAASIEMIHTATLLHDDVVDNASLRRGHPTAHTLWGNEASVLVGDFLYSRAFQCIVKLQDLKIIHYFSEAMHLIAEGEVLQLVNCRNPATTEQSYFEIIQRKTAKLFEVAAQSGAALANATPQQLRAMQYYGLQLGMAYQLIDDTLDFSLSAEKTGKNRGNDLLEGKLTLPVIYALQKLTGGAERLLREAIQTKTQENVATILSMVESTGAIEYTASAAKKCVQEATLALQHIPDSPYRQALQNLAEFVVERDY